MKNYRYEAKVDIVPMINVSLIVVLALMLIAPFLSPTGQPVDLPRAQASEVNDTDKAEVICTLDGRIFVGEQQVTIEELRPVLAASLQHAPHAVTVVRADRALLYGQVERVLAEVEAAKAERIAIATRDHDGPEAK